MFIAAEIIIGCTGIAGRSASGSDYWSLDRPHSMKDVWRDLSVTTRSSVFSSFSLESSLVYRPPKQNKKWTICQPKALKKQCDSKHPAPSALPINAGFNLDCIH